MSEPQEDATAAAATATAAGAVREDPFLSSMTFASGVQRDCDCDECGLCVAGGSGASVTGGTRSGIPADVAAFVREQKRLKLASGAVTRRQERVLVARAEGGLGASVYRLTMPPGAEPLVEFGNSHRIVVVDRLKEGSCVKSIGKGIVGSSDEEKGRTAMQWEEGKAYLMPCNGGRAMGWISENVEKEGGTGGGGGNVVLFMVKITPEAMENIPDDKEFTDGWVRDVLHVFQQNLKSSAEGKNMEQDRNESSTITTLSNLDCRALKKLIPPLLDAKGF